jgi:organic radical activating enzyme
MFGKNPITKPRSAKEGFSLHSIFLSIQGEGPFSGLPALFVRFAGCSHKCIACDTDFDKGEHLSLEELVARIKGVHSTVPSYRIVLTGGEPMIQPLTNLIVALYGEGINVIDIETAGTDWPEEFEDVAHLTHIICSPKTAHVHPRIKTSALAFKYVIREGFVDLQDGLPLISMWTSANNLVNIGTARLYRGVDRRACDIYVQPCDDQDPELNARNLHLCASISMKYGYRFSVQLHKLLGME